MTISEKIKEIVDQKGTSLQWLSEKIGMTKAGFYKMLDSNSFKVDTLQKIADVLEVPIVIFFGETQKEDKEAPKENPFLKLTEALVTIIAVWAAMSALSDYIERSRANDKKTKDEVLDDIENQVQHIIESLGKMNEKEISTNQ